MSIINQTTSFVIKVLTNPFFWGMLLFLLIWITCQNWQKIQRTAITKFKRGFTQLKRKFKQIKVAPKQKNKKNLFTIYIILIFVMLYFLKLILPQYLLNNLDIYIKIHIYEILIIGLFILGMILLVSVYTKHYWFVLCLFCLAVEFWFIKPREDIILNFLLIGLSVITLLILFYIIYISKIKTPLWISFTILIMLFIFLAGVLVLDGAYGSRSLIINEKNISITCGEDGFYLVNSTVSCSTNPVLNMTDATVFFVSKLGRLEEQEFTHLTFIAPPAVSAIYFKINGTTQDNKIVFGTTRRYIYTFYDINQSEERTKLYFTYLLALVGIILFSIPAMMKTFKDMWDSERRKSKK